MCIRGNNAQGSNCTPDIVGIHIVSNASLTDLDTPVLGKSFGGPMYTPINWSMSTPRYGVIVIGESSGIKYLKSCKSIP